MPVIFCVLVLGILTASTKVVSFAMFFMYVIAVIVFNYLGVNKRIGKEYMREDIRPYLQLVSGIFMLVLFISYLIRT